MKITAITPYICDCFRTNWVFLKVETDEGVYGWGEASLEYREKTVVEAMLEIARNVIGRNAFEIQSIWDEANREVYFRGGPVYMSALGALEMALWDIKGKALGVPVYELFGGAVRDRITCYANAWFSGAKEPEEFAAKAKLAMEAGYKGLKWDPFGAAYLELTPAELKKAEACVAAVAEVVDGKAELLIEGHGRFDVPTAVRAADMIAAHNVGWFEEPLPPGNLEALADVRRRSRVPIAAGERLYSRWDYISFFESRCADFAQPDVTHVGGMSELKRIAETAEGYFLPCCPHNPCGPVANAATLHIAASTMNIRRLETMATDVNWRTEIAQEEAGFEDGCLTIPQVPGLGVEIDIEAMKAHPYQAHDLRHYKGTLTDIRPKDSGFIFKK
ncbi:mandelate racemase/muconate lactonizing enzyme family protein [Coraliomargarita algicola]|uniref:Mandelate racemase/muconate lactonizing enzyme family protein n=1 Tax=Coraliomargarita algicola TaxID=3092156 RepID=A0ABZ0RKW0_9BACT|nr:mandelate racemase/muconate lactonizing enzyme family protein [Coraliomargarita sp. J2-16]WPJ96851.1 mandelate racemase/muconate lactonizing enzyme family protein [Coraliomargarita sp. J2-16]